MRRNEGQETWHRLLEWDRGQAAAERLSSLILSYDNYKEIDPSHPLGGRDGGKDIIVKFNNNKWIVGVYFPRGQNSFLEIKNKFIHDIKGVKRNSAYGFVFVTNQELRLSERKELSEIDTNISTEIYHLERISSILNNPANYGMRMDFLDIEMSKEEQLAFFASHDKKISDLENMIKRVSMDLDSFKLMNSCKDKNDDSIRFIEEIRNAEEELYEKVWFDRHMGLKYNIENGKEKVDPEIWKEALKAEAKMIKKYGHTS